MPKLNVVPLSRFAAQGVGLSRLDAEFTDPITIATEERLVGRFNAVCLSSLLCEETGIAPSTTDADESVSQARYIAINSVDRGDGFTFYESLPVQDLPSRAKYRVETNDILVSNVRPERNSVAFIIPELRHAIASSGFTLLRVSQSSHISPEFLFAFLKSDYAVAQLMRRNRGSMYPAVVSEDVKSVVIPRLPVEIEDKVREFVVESNRKKSSFYKLKKQIDEKLRAYLSKNLGDAPPSPLEPQSDNPSFSIRRSSEFFSTDGNLRFDADFFRQEYFDFSERLVSTGSYFRLGDEYQALTGNPLGKETHEAILLKQAALTGFGINWESGSEVRIGEIKRKDVLQPEDILLACTAHEIFYVARRADMVDSVPDKVPTVVVPDLMILRKRKLEPLVPPSFVGAFLLTDWGRHQVQRLIRGLRGGHVYAADVERNVLVPVPDMQWMTEFEAENRLLREHRRDSLAAIRNAVRELDRWLGKAD